MIVGTYFFHESKIIYSLNTPNGNQTVTISELVWLGKDWSLLSIALCDAWPESWNVT